MANQYLENLFINYPELEKNKREIQSSVDILIEAYENDKKLLIAGNGGSAADAEHIVGELMKSFILDRPLGDDLKKGLIEVDRELGKSLSDKLQSPLTALALTGHPSLTTAFNNDVNSNYNYAQQVLGYGKVGDVFLGISTSGNSENIYAAAVVAKALGMSVLVLSGQGKGKLSKLADAAIHVPSKETYRIQEYHLPIYHAICIKLEEHFFKNDKTYHMP